MYIACNCMLHAQPGVNFNFKAKSGSKSHLGQLAAYSWIFLVAELSCQVYTLWNLFFLKKANTTLPIKHKQKFPSKLHLT